MSGRKREVGSFCKGRGCVVNREEKNHPGAVLYRPLEVVSLAPRAGGGPQSWGSSPPKPLPGLQPLPRTPPGSSAFSGHDSPRPKNNCTDVRKRAKACGTRGVLSYGLIADSQKAGNLTQRQAFIEGPWSPALATSPSNASPWCSAVLSAFSRLFRFPSRRQLASAARITWPAPGEGRGHRETRGRGDDAIKRRQSSRGA